MTARRPRTPRHRPLLKLPVPGYHVTVHVRTARLSGTYEVDPGFHLLPDGCLTRTGGSQRAVGRLAAVRAAQHNARRHRAPSATPTGRVPTGAWTPMRGVPDGTLAHPLRYTFGSSLAKHPNGTYVLSTPDFISDDEWRNWTERAYRNRHTAVQEFQWARRFVPTGAAGQAERRSTD